MKREREWFIRMIRGNKERERERDWFKYFFDIKLSIKTNYYYKKERNIQGKIRQKAKQNKEQAPKDYNQTMRRKWQEKIQSKSNQSKSNPIADFIKSLTKNI